MPTFDSVSKLLETLFDLRLDVVRFVSASLRSRCALAAENLFLRKQLALRVERHRQPRRVMAPTKLRSCWRGAKP